MKRSEKQQRFSIRKFTVGVASVAIAAFWMVSGSGVAADEIVVDTNDAVEVFEETPEVGPNEGESVEEVDLTNAEEEPADEPTVDSTVVEEEAIEEPILDAEIEPENSVEESVIDDVQTEAQNEPVEVTSEEPIVEPTVEEIVEDEPVAEEVATRQAATTYRVQYIDIETTEVVKQANYSVAEVVETPANEKHRFDVEVSLDIPAGYTAISAENNAGDTFEVVNNAISAYVVEKESSTRTLKVNVRKDDVTNTNNNGFTMLRAVDNSSLKPEPNHGGAYIDPSEVGTPTSVAVNSSGAQVPIAELAANTFWMNFADPDATITNAKTTAKGNTALQVGTTWSKEVTPGYVVTAEVVELKPYAQDETNINFDPARKGTPADVVVLNPDITWSHIKSVGLVDANEKVAFGSEDDGANIGVTWKVTATYNGKPVTPTVVVSDAEEAGDLEALIMKTDGTPWEIYANAKDHYQKGGDTSSVPGDASFDKGNYTVITERQIEGRGNANSSFVQKGGYTASEWVTTDPTGGLGTQQFGPVRTSKGGASVPLVMTTATSTDGVNVSAYINSAGKQQVAFAFAVSDRGDAPLSYGTAMHLINPEDDPNPPYLGTVKADIDVDPIEDAWKTDDTSGGDEGNEQLTGKEFIEYISAGETVYTMDIKANPGDAGTAYVRGFVDFNNNGVFDASEASDIVTVNGDGTYKLTWSNPPQITDTSMTRAGVRIRIAKNESEVEGPTGVATSGEVEDFQTQVIHPPRGEYKETEGLRGQTQTSKVNFTAYGELRDSEAPNEMDTTIDVKIVDPDGNLVTEYTEPGEGKYIVAPDGSITFIPDPGFVGTAKGIVLRATDKNGLTTGWTSETGASSENDDESATENTLANVNDGTHTIGTKTMDSVYIPRVKDIDLEGDEVETTGKQGQEQSGTPTFELKDEDGNPISQDNVEITGYTFDDGSTEKVIPGEGTYTLDPETGEVTFKPEPTFTGKGTGVEVIATATITNEDGSTSEIKAPGKYTPTVTPVTPTAEPAESEDVQGKPQTKSVTFKEGDADVPIDNSTITLLDEDGNEVSEIDAVDENGKVVGKYSVNPDGSITFTPEPDFVGTPKPARVQAKDVNGTLVETTYTPTVTPVTPSAEDDETTGPQGAEQVSELVFKPGHDDVPIKIDETQPAKLIDPTTGEPTDATTLPAMKDGKEVGTYTIDPLTGQVTFKPNPDFVGEPDPITVQVKDANGTPTEATYQPKVTPVTPTADPITSEGKQGETQTKSPEDVLNMFNEGDSVAPIDPTTVTLLDADGNPATEVEAVDEEGNPVGKFVLNEDGSIDFIPNKDYDGTIPVKPVEVQAKDTNGTPAKSTYTPKVTPVVPTATPAETEDVKGKPQYQDTTTMFKEGDAVAPIDNSSIVFVDENGNEVKELTIPGEGTYTVDENGQITFTPDPDFVGTATPVIVKAKDANGTPVETTYTPTVLPLKTSFVTEDGEELSPTEEGELDPKVFDGYYVSDTKVDEDGNITHVYAKKTTSYVTEDGTVLSPTEDGTLDPKVFDDYYVVDKKVDENGNVTHIYAKKTTSYVDEDGNELKPTADGTLDADGIDEYYFTGETRKDENGNITHVYAKKSTSYILEDGTELKVPESGLQDPADFPGFYVKETKVDEKGNRIHVYAPVETTYVDENGNPIQDPTKGANPNEPIEGWEFVKSETDKDGNVKNVYRKVEEVVEQPKTSFVTTDGTVLAPTVDGVENPREFSGYKLVDTQTDDDKNVKHVYEPIVIKRGRVEVAYVDENGKELVKGTFADAEVGKGYKTGAAAIPGYELVAVPQNANGTIPDGTAKVVYVYRKVAVPVETPVETPVEKPVDEKPTEKPVTETPVTEETPEIPEVVVEESKTMFVDIDGNEVAPTVDNLTDAIEIDGYELVETIEENGVRKHVYKAVVKETPAEVAKMSEKAPESVSKTVVSTPVQVVAPAGQTAVNAKSEPSATVSENVLPNTGDASGVSGLVGMMLASFGLAGLKRRKED